MSRPNYGDTRSHDALTLDSLASLHSREEVEPLYVTEGLSQVEAAKRLGTTTIKFHALLLRYGIAYRHPAQVSSI